MKFILTKELGRLAKWLRILGYDSKFYRDDNLSTLVIMALREERIILTRNSRISRFPGPRLVIINSDFVDKQLRQILRQLKLKPKSQDMFSRCVICNIELEEIITHLVSLDVQYLASDKTWKTVEEGSKIYGTSDSSDKVRLNIIDKYEAYGIKTIVNYFNATPSNGIIEISYNETTKVYEKAQMSKLRIYTFDKSSENQPIQPIR